MNAAAPLGTADRRPRLAALGQRWGTALLLALLLWLQFDLWFGKGNWPETMRQARELEAAQARLADSRERNARVSAEVSDLQEGLEMVEEKARSELGMLRAHEVFVQLGDGARPAAEAAPAPSSTAAR